MSSRPGALRFGLAIAAAHLLLVLPILVWHHGDVSVFVVAGDRFAAAAPIAVRAHSDGYDGQFYYRLALAPLSAQAQAFGITLDHPAWRAQRIFYPVLAHVLALGQARAIPAALLGINIAGIFAIAALAWRLAVTSGAPRLLAWAVALWPGWLVALTHDTTEILAGALLLAALSAAQARRMALYAGLMALATLTRETAILIAAGIALGEAWAALRRRRDAAPAAWAVAALLPFLAWRQAVEILWRDAPQAHGLAENAGFPLLGYAETVAAALLNRAIGAAARPRTGLLRWLTLMAAAWIGGFCAAIARAAWRNPGPLAIGVALLLALMSVLTANGPWVEPTAAFRAFSETWLAGWVLLACTGGAPRRPEAPWALAVLAAPVLLRNWELCLIQLR